MKNYLFLFLAISLFTVISCDKEDDEEKEDPNAETITLDSSIDAPTTLENIFISPDKIDYIIDSRLTVNAALTIMPGVRIQMGSAGRIDVNPSGSVNATGTQQNRIFIEGEQASKGFWEYFRFRSNNPSNALHYCTVSHGGGNGSTLYNSMIILDDNAQLAMSNNNISSSNSNGVMVRRAENRLTEFSNNTISNCSLYPVTILANQLDAMESTNVFTEGNGFNFIQIVDSTIPVALTIPRSAGPYLFSGNMTINGAVTVDAGTEIAMGPKSRINVGNSGSLRLNGELGNRIKIYGQENANGYWDYLRYQGSNSPNNIILYTDISYGGGTTSSLTNGSVILDGGQLSMGNSSISNSQSYGLKVRGNGVFDDLGNNVFNGNILGDTDGL